MTPPKDASNRATGRSLKAYAPQLAKIFATTPDAIYERQRALVRAGLLKESGARGPGGGVRATPKAVATLVIALLGANEIRDIDAHVRNLLALKCEPFDSPAQSAPFDARTSLLDALTWAISDPAHARHVMEIGISRTGGGLAQIFGRTGARNLGASAKKTKADAYKIRRRSEFLLPPHNVSGLAPWSAFFGKPKEHESFFAVLAMLTFKPLVAIADQLKSDGDFDAHRTEEGVDVEAKARAAEREDGE